jgi:hypothetical protein
VFFQQRLLKRSCCCSLNSQAKTRISTRSSSSSCSSSSRNMRNDDSLLSRSLSSLADYNNQPFRLTNAAKCMLTRSLSAKVIKAERTRFKNDKQQADTLRRSQLVHRKSTQQLLPLGWPALAAVQLHKSASRTRAICCGEQSECTDCSTVRPSTAASSSRPVLQVC